MTYACDDCGFLFSRVWSVSGCPLCDGMRIRMATEEEGKTLRTKIEQKTHQTNQNERKTT